MTTRPWSHALWLTRIVAFPAAASQCGSCQSYPGYGVPVNPPIPPLKTTPSPYRPTPRPTRTPTPTPTPLPDADDGP